MNTINLLSDARFFDDSNTRLHQLRTQLDSKLLKDKLDAMKSLTAHMTLGRDMSAFFPDVVKNVIVESQEVKKLVYMFLITYSEHNQDLALLSINTFQKDLASPSQRIRANAMKAMSAIRIPVAIPLVMLALKAAVKDNSSYVKRAAACAIPKMHSADTDADHHDELIAMVSELLSCVDPVVLGSALFAFNAVCPARYELLHRHYRKVCHLLADFDEWGQCVALDVLCRYGRTQFLSPFAKEAPTGGESGASGLAAAGGSRSASGQKASKDESVVKSKRKAKKKSDNFYSDEDSEDTPTSASASVSEEESEEDDEEVESAAPALDDDHLLLLRQSQSLLHSPNTAVVLSIATLHWYLAPSQLCAAVIPPLVRLCRNKRSVQYVLLTNVLTMCKARPALFAPHVKDFYVNVSDAAYVKALKLEILSYIVDDGSVASLVRELTVYAHDADAVFVCAAIGCVGRCAVRLPAVAERCLQLLMRLVTSPVDAVVAEAVVTIRQLLQSQSAQHAAVVRRMARLLERVRAPTARSAIVWMVGEYRDLIPRMAPDTLRRLAQSYRDEDETVKLQILNLAVKLYLWRPKEVSLLFKYVMDMSKYDLSYDIRDRARLMRALFFKKKDTAAAAAATASAALSAAVAAPAATGGAEVKDALKQLFLVPKPPPTVDDTTAAHDRYTLGTLSHTLGVAVSGYSELPDFPLMAPSSEARKPVEEYEAEERRERERKRAAKGRGGGRSGGRGESASEEDESDSGREEASDFSEFDASEDDRSGSASDRSRSERSDSGSDSDRDRSDSGSERRRKRRAAASKSERTKGGSARRSRSESESEEESSEKSDSEDSRDRRRRRRRGRNSESESESESRSDVDSEQERRGRKQKEKEKARAEKEKAERERERKEAEKQKSRRVEEEKKQKEAPKGKGGKDDSKKAGKSNMGDLLDLSNLAALSSPVSQPSLPAASASPLSPTAASAASSAASSASASAATSPRSTAVAMPGLTMPSRGQRGQLLNPISSGGLRIDYTFSRKPSLYGRRFVAVDLLYVNESTAAFKSTALSEEDSANEKASEGMSDVEAMGALGVGQQQSVKLQVDFKGKVQPRVWRVSIGGGGDYAVRLTPDVGELVRPALLSSAEWEAKARRLSGMSEHKLDVQLGGDAERRAMAQALLAVCNMAVLGGGEAEGDAGLGVLRMSGQRLDEDEWVLLKLVVRSAGGGGAGGRVQCVVHCEDFLFGTSLADAVKKALS